MAMSDGETPWSLSPEAEAQARAEQETEAENAPETEHKKAHRVAEAITDKCFAEYAENGVMSRKSAASASTAQVMALAALGRATGIAPEGIIHATIKALEEVYPGFKAETREVPPEDGPSGPLH